MAHKAKCRQMQASSCWQPANTKQVLHFILILDNQDTCNRIDLETVKKEKDLDVIIDTKL